MRSPCEAKLQQKRACVFAEIWHSETTYLEGLMCLLQFFYYPLIKQSTQPNRVATFEQTNFLFGNLMELIGASKSMVSQFARALSGFNSSTRVGHIFIDNYDILVKTFTAYVDTFEEANNLFQTLRKNDNFKSWLQNIEYKQCDLSFESYLVMPIQRVTRYVMLVKELVRQTWVDHNDYDTLVQALGALEMMARHVNEHKQKLINEHKVKSTLDHIVGLPPLESNVDRLYITEGAVTDLQNDIPVMHYIFLFSDVMIWTQLVNKKKFVFRKLNWLKETTAESGVMTSFSITTKDWSTTVFTKTKEEQNKWLAYLENDNFIPPSQAPKLRRPDIVFLDKGCMNHEKPKSIARRKAEVGLAKTLKNTSLNPPSRVSPSEQNHEKSFVLSAINLFEGSLKLNASYSETQSSTETKEHRRVPKNNPHTGGYSTLNFEQLFSSSSDKRSQHKKKKEKKRSKQEKKPILPGDLLSELRHANALEGEEKQRYLRKLTEEKDLPPKIGSSSTQELTRDAVDKGVSSPTLKTSKNGVVYNTINLTQVQSKRPQSDRSKKDGGSGSLRGFLRSHKKDKGVVLDKPETG
ncbi:spermatogenesis-associated protein 13-like isoform X2 [Schistocerca gregaria]|uniref:spermatogenesis-associated protein 13-like isoform X2 n=1 Tax=Schistocerca gregaria TaxID=7010 RepID=UPI00211F1289|nr:spermatogenesis-associated protein 13-like isoform X2 [Schistocerca gregaria]